MMQKPITYLFLLSTLFAYSQTTYTISGNVFDDQHEGITIGDVLLFPENGDTPIKYTTIIDGKFSLEAIAERAYRLRISCLGFKDMERVFWLNKDLTLDIELPTETTNLNEVELVAAKPIITHKNGTLKVDITNQIFSGIPNAMELLERLPNLQVSPDRESVALIGKGAPLIYLGDQRISINELNGLSVNDIATIEIIQNPSSKYEAEGRAVLLITRRISETEGIMLDISETLSLKRNFNNYSGIDLNYKKGKISIKSNFAYNALRTWERNGFEFEIPAQNIYSDYLVLLGKNNRTQINGGAGFFYQINEFDYLSLNSSIRKQADVYDIGTNTFLRQDAEEDDIISKSINDQKKDFSSINFNLNKRLKSNFTLFTGLQWSNHVQGLDTGVWNNFNGTGFVHFQDREQKYKIDVLAYRLDIEKSWQNEMKWEFGSHITNAWANASTSIEAFETPIKTDLNYDYVERITAGYSQLSGKITNKMNISAGIRIETNSVKGVEENLSLVDREDTLLFPNAKLNIELDSTKNLTLNYSKNIGRPNYSNASSISVFLNPFLEGEGSPNLLPTVSQKLSADLQYKKYALSVHYSRSRNPIYYTIGYTDGEDKAIFSLKNLEKEYTFDISLTLPFSKGIWTSTNTTSLIATKIEDDTAKINRIRPYIYWYTDHQFRIANALTISFGAWGRTEQAEGIFERNGLLSLNAAIAKTFLNKLTCSLRFNDIAGGLNFDEKYSINGVNAKGTYFTDIREVAFGLKYSLGNMKDRSFKNKDIDGDLDRIR